MLQIWNEITGPLSAAEPGLRGLTSLKSLAWASEQTTDTVQPSDLGVLLAPRLEKASFSFDYNDDLVFDIGEVAEAFGKLECLRELKVFAMACTDKRGVPG
eukprot:scaffold672637_cov86-Prasinocladus_malaysianus.AAC.1